MIIECHHCFTTFLVDDYKINENSRIVKCSTCNYEKLYTSNVALRKKYVRKKRKNCLPLYFILPALLLFLTLTLQRDIIIQQHQIMMKFYSFFGFDNTKDLKIEVNGQVTSAYYGKNNVIFYYKVPLDLYNNSNKWRYVPAIRIIAQDDNNIALDEYTHPLRIELKPFSGKKIVLESGFSFADINHVAVQILNR